MFSEIIIALLLGWVVIRIFDNQRAKSFEYRKLLTNLYVAGKIKEIAKKDNIDLKEEYKDFRKLSHKRYKDIDSSIEDRISEKIKKETESNK